MFEFFPIFFMLLYFVGIVLIILAIVHFLRLQQKRVNIEQERNEILARLIDRLPATKENTGL